MRRPLTILLASLAALFATASAAQAVMVSVGGSQYGVALVPGTDRVAAGVTTAPAPGGSPCDPWLAPDLAFPTPVSGLCWHGGPVMRSNQTFDLTWDPIRSDWATTRDYVEQFLRDVANGSGTLTSPYAVTTQYRDSGGRAG